MNEKVSNIGRLWANSITGGFESLILNKDDLCGFHKLVKESFEADDILAQCDFEELFLDNIWFKKQPLKTNTLTILMNDIVISLNI